MIINLDSIEYLLTFTVRLSSNSNFIRGALKKNISKSSDFV
jgi:hypothetical protein